MQKALQKILSLFIKIRPPQTLVTRKSRGQSLVEVAISFPILIMLFTGVVEFGFILNTYLSLVDATRDSARYWSNDDPFKDDPLHPGTLIDDDDFYFQTAFDVQKLLDPSTAPGNSDYVGRRISLDPDIDDVIVSVYGADDSGSWLWRDTGVYHLDIDHDDSNGVTNGGYTSIFTAASIESTRVADAPNAGLLLVEVHYNYHHVLGLPWMTAWLPNPLHLQAYTIMPIRAGEPEPAP